MIGNELREALDYDQDPDELAQELMDICSRNPGHVNPTDMAGACLYTGEDGTHCLVGQWLSERGVTVTYEDTDEGEPVDAIVGSFLNRKAVSILLQIQQLADGGNDSPPLWSSVADIYGAVDYPDEWDES